MMVNNAVSLARVNWQGPELRFVKGSFLVLFAHQALKKSQMIPQNKKGSFSPGYQARLSLV